MAHTRLLPLVGVAAAAVLTAGVVTVLGSGDGPTDVLRAGQPPAAEHTQTGKATYTHSW